MRLREAGKNEMGVDKVHGPQMEADIVSSCMRKMNIIGMSVVDKKWLRSRRASL